MMRSSWWKWPMSDVLRFEIEFWFQRCYFHENPTYFERVTIGGSQRAVQFWAADPSQIRGNRLSWSRFRDSFVELLIALDYLGGLSDFPNFLTCFLGCRNARFPESSLFRFLSGLIFDSRRLILVVFQVLRGIKAVEDLRRRAFERIVWDLPSRDFFSRKLL